MVSFAQFFAQHRNEDSQHNLLIRFLRWGQHNQFNESDPTVRILLKIEEVVVGYYDLTLMDVRGKRRYAELVRARQVITHLSLKLVTQHGMANAIGVNRNNVQSRNSKCAILMETEPQLRKEVAEIEKKLKGLILEIEAEQFEKIKEPSTNN